MKSGTSFFNGGIFRSILKRTWLMWAVYFAVLFISLPLVTISGRVHDVHYANADFFPPYLSLGIYDDTASLCAVFAFIMAIVVACMVFSFIFSARSTGLIAATPAKREAVFGAAYMAGLLPLLCIDLVIALLNVLASVGSSSGMGPVWSCNAMLFVLNAAEFMIFYGIAVFVIMISSSAVATPVLYVIFNFLVAGMESIVNSIIYEFGFGAVHVYGKLGFLSPMTKIFNFDFSAVPDVFYRDNYFADFNNWAELLIYLGAGLVLSVIALSLYRRHRMESAGDVISIPALRPVFKYGVAVCAALSYGVSFFLIMGTVLPGRVYSFSAMLLGLISGAFIGYFGSDMLMKKSFRVFRGNWLGFAVLSVLCLAFLLCCNFDVLGLSTKLPTADEVEYVVTDDMSVKFSSEEDINEFLRINRAIIDNRSKYLKLEHVEFDPEEDIVFIGFSYWLKNGTCISRSYTILNDENYADYTDVICRPDVAKQYYTPQYVAATVENVESAEMQLHTSGTDACVALSPTQAMDFYNEGLMRDVDDGNAGASMLKTIIGWGFESVSVAEFSLHLVKLEDGVGQEWDYVYFAVTPECENSVRWISENLGIDLTVTPK